MTGAIDDRGRFLGSMKLFGFATKPFSLVVFGVEKSVTVRIDH